MTCRECQGGGPWGSPVGAWGSLGAQFWATLAFQSVTDGPPEQFWDTAGLKNERFRVSRHFALFYQRNLVLVCLTLFCVLGTLYESTRR